MEEDNGERWQTKITSLRQGVSHIYKSKEFSDVQFLVEGQYYIKGHRIILSTTSRKLANMLLNVNTPDLINIDEETITKVGFEGLLRFMYTDVLNIGDKNEIIQTYLAACYFEQKELQEKCERLIGSWAIDADEVCNLFQLGVHLSILRNKCIEFMTENGSAVLDSPSFLQTTLNSLCSMLKCGALDKVPVLKRIDAVMNWFANHYQSSDVDYTDIRNTLQTCSDIPLLSKLHFESLSLDELADVMDKYDGLITAEENKRFMRYLRRKDVSLLPDWCVVTTEQ